MSVTLVVPVHNRPADVQVCINGLYGLTQRPFRVIVVDDGSRCPVAGFGPRVEVARIPRRRGTAYAKNVGLAMTRTRYVWFLDSDSRLTEPRCLQYMIETLDADERIGALGAEGHMVRDRLLLNVKGLYPNMETRTQYMHPSNVLMHEVEVIGTNNMLTRTGLLREAGGFVENLEIGEDKVYCQWLRRHGWRCVEDGRFVVHHGISGEARGSLWAWQVRNEVNRVRVALTLLPAWKWPILPLLDVWSKHRYLWLVRARRRREGGSASPHKAAAWLKLFVFYAAWFYSYLPGLCFSTRALRLKKEARC